MAFKTTIRRSDDEFMDEWRARIGAIARPTLNDAPFCRLITEDAVLNVCLSVGDLNPLWISSEYARPSRYGSNLAPPYMLFALAPWSMHGGVFAGIRDESGRELPRPGASGVQGGITLEWRRRLRCGDRIACEARLADARTHRSRTWGRTFELVAEFVFRDDAGDTVATGRFSWLGTEHRDVQAPPTPLVPKTWTPQEIEDVRAEYARQPAKIRGSRPLYWEDVEEGEAIPAIIKGPYTETSYITFCLGIPLRTVHSTDDVFWNHVYESRMHGTPHRGPLGSNELTHQGVPAGQRYHFDYETARGRGLPAPIDVGHQRVCWIAQMLSMWMGDHGFLMRLETRHVDVNMMGDVTWCEATVRAKSTENGRHLVTLDVSCRSQRGPSTRGTATVALPSRALGGLSDV